ncbi:general secretion pathway protein K [Geoanaerobacter pelophilus]|uniref:General secretion pathway protein K n=1 Tax=Geoanaerobacter pelophilus TaxID=60036 RepID=A0ABQ0MLN9_9BACT|nr:type II secretion system minor pseudopilin GspK [Geoanaerobacter pelophilus]GAW67707.1 general secretion pathway protein K [Geoanaerobacter pelophilus]
MRGEKGFALVITLIVTTLLVALLVEFVNEVYVDTSHSHNFVASQQAGILAESGVAGGIKLLQVSSAMRLGAAYSSLLEPWAKPQSFETDNGTVTITIEEESGKLNLNSATTTNGTSNEQTLMLVRLLTRLKLPTDLGESLMDWVDENDTPLPGGAESSYYGNLKLPYAAKNRPLETVEELALVKGYTPEVLMKLRALVTTYGASTNGEHEAGTKINVNTANRDLLAAIDDKMTDDLVDRIIDYRKTHPIKDGDLNKIPGVDSIAPFISLKVCYMGSVYRIRSEGKVGESVAVAEAVVRTGGTTPEVLYWREY